MTVFAARYPGRCHHGDKIRPGDEVEYFELPGCDGSVLVHTGCLGESDQSTRDDGAPYCPLCFCFHRGECA